MDVSGSFDDERRNTLWVQLDKKNEEGPVNRIREAFESQYSMSAIR